MYKTIIDFTTKNDSYKRNNELQVKGLMLHSTATPGIMAQEFRDRFDKAGLGKSVHGFLDDTCYVQCLPYSKKAGHCRYDGNNTHIGIELCEPAEWKTDAEYFNKVYKNAVELFASLCKKFGLNEQNIIDHAEGYKLGIASNHSDVGHWFPLFGKSMDTFRADVKKQLASITQTESVDETKENVKDLQIALNAAYRTGLVVDGSFGEKTAAAVKAHILKYKKGNTVKKGAYVKWVQNRLLALGYSVGKSGVDGSYGKNTAEAVEKMQKADGLTADGIVGINTTQALVKVKQDTGKQNIKNMQTALNEAYNAGLAVDGSYGSKTTAAVKAHLLRYKEGHKTEKGAYVKWVQKRLTEKGYSVGSAGIDGSYGKNTAAAVEKLQRAAGISADGVVGVDTTKALIG